MAKEKGEIRLLRADEIECRIGTMNERGLSLLLWRLISQETGIIVVGKSMIFKIIGNIPKFV